MVLKIQTCVAYLFFGLGLLAPCLQARMVGILSVELVGDRISLSAQNHSLSDLLSDLAKKGVAVYVDPSIDVKISGRIDHEVFEDVMDRLLEGHSYITRWEVVEGPVGAWPRLKELRIFRSGAPQLARAVFTEDTSGLRVVQDAHGHLIVQNEILIGLKAGTTPKEFEALLSRLRGVVVESIPTLGIYRIRLPEHAPVEALVADLIRQQQIAVAEPHYVYSPVGTAPLQGNTSPVPLQPPTAPAAAGLRPIAVLDTGLSRSLNMGSLLQGSFDATKSAAAQGRLNDSVGHGSQMALIASGMVQPSGGTSGAAQVPVLAIRAFDDEGRATGFSLMQSIDYALENGSRVLSLSWGSGANSAFLEGAMRYAAGKGAIVVAAAGNEPTGKAVYPAAYAQTIAVAALDATGTRWSQSNYGDFVDIAAAGYAVLPVGYQGAPGAYIGTSIATPYVARWIEQYLVQHPTADVAAVKKALSDAATDAGEPGRDPFYGAGILSY